MTLPQNVKDAVDAADEAAKIASNDSEGVAQWNLIRAHLLSQDAEISNLRDDRDSWLDQASQRLEDWDDMRRRAESAESRIDAIDAELKILRVKCSGTLANNLCPDHRDKQVGNPCLACTIEKLQSRLAAANALLRFMHTRFDACMDDSDRASIEAHLSENADVQP